jgi:hypothetical protein
VRKGKEYTRKMSRCCPSWQPVMGVMEPKLPSLMYSNKEAQKELK